MKYFRNLSIVRLVYSSTYNYLPYIDTLECIEVSIRNTRRGRNKTGNAKIDVSFQINQSDPHFFRETFFHQQLTTFFDSFQTSQLLFLWNAREFLARFEFEPADHPFIPVASLSKCDNLFSEPRNRCSRPSTRLHPSRTGRRGFPSPAQRRVIVRLTPLTLCRHYDVNERQASILDGLG